VKLGEVYVIEGAIKMPRKSQQVAVEVAENIPKNKVGKEKTFWQTNRSDKRGYTTES